MHDHSTNLYTVMTSTFVHLTDIVAAANIAGYELDGPRCEIRTFLTKFDVWNPVIVPIL